MVNSSCVSELTWSSGVLPGLHLSGVCRNGTGCAEIHLSWEQECGEIGCCELLCMSWDGKVLKRAAELWIQWEPSLPSPIKNKGIFAVGEDLEWYLGITDCCVCLWECCINAEKEETMFPVRSSCWKKKEEFGSYT